MEKQRLKMPKLFLYESSILEFFSFFFGSALGFFPKSVTNLSMFKILLTLVENLLVRRSLC